MRLLIARVTEDNEKHGLKVGDMVLVDGDQRGQGWDREKVFGMFRLPVKTLGNSFYKSQLEFLDPQEVLELKPE